MPRNRPFRRPRPFDDALDVVVGDVHALALAMRSRSLELTLGSPPPAFTHTDIYGRSFVKILGALAVRLFLFRLILFHLLCPDIKGTPKNMFSIEVAV